MKPYGFLGVGVAAGFLLGAVAMNFSDVGNANAAGKLDKTEVEAIVREYIAGHGTELLQSIQTAMSQVQQDKLGTMITPATPTKGPADAPVTIIEFSDFQCPFCDRVQPGLVELRAKYGDKIRWAFKFLPLEFHPEAKPAAYASLAANKQGKFWEYSQLLWSKQASLGEKTYVAVAQELKLDMDKFNKDRASDEVKKQVETDLADAEAAGARGTPHFLINGEALSGAQPASEFSKVIDADLAKAAKK